MLLTNQRLDKLASARTHFVELGMLPPSHAPPPPPDRNGENDDEGPVDEIVMGDVQLARTRGELSDLISTFHFLTYHFGHFSS